MVFGISVIEATGSQAAPITGSTHPESSDSASPSQCDPVEICSFFKKLLIETGVRRMSQDQEWLHLELLCKHLYESSNASERAEAEKALISFENSEESLPKCQLLLERGTSSYAQVLAAHTLNKLVSRPNCPLSTSQKVEMRSYILRYLATRPQLAAYVTQALVSLYARITKLGWFDREKEEFMFRNVIGDVTNFLQGSVDHCVMGVQLLSTLVCEMNQVSECEANRSISKHRKIAASFRDTHLFEIFQLSCALLRSALENCKKLSYIDDSQQNLMHQLLKLAHNCLTFDFIGTSIDESSDDLCTVQIPTSWRPAFLSFSTLQLFFDLYSVLPVSISPMALSCLVQLASVRRSLFNNTERAKFLNQLVSGVKTLLQNPRGLSDHNNYHEFCRLLARLKTNYQLGELVTVDNYPQFIELIANFTVQSLQMWQFAPNSVHYLLSLWQRMVASVPYVKSTEPHMLEVYTPEVTKAYITSRLESVPVVLREGLEDPLDDWGLVQQQLDQLSTIGRCQYTKTVTLLAQLFDSTAQEFQQLISDPSKASLQEVRIKEGQLTWLVYIIGAAVGGRVSFNTSEEHDSMDGEIVCRVLQLMNLTDSQLSQGGSQQLELAMLSFMEQFRKIYIGDQVQKTPKVYRRLSENLGLEDESMVLSVFIRKIITNLRYWGACEAILTRTLSLLNDLSVGYSSVRRLVKLEEVQFLLSHHTPTHFPFLGVGLVGGAEMKCRSTFYTALGRLLMVDLGEDEDKFISFMIPLATSFESVGKLVLEGGEAAASNESAKKALIGLARDLRGLAFAFNNKAAFGMFFDWMGSYPTYTPILVRALEIWFTDPQVTTPILKFYAEFVVNRSQRLNFDVSSPNGILLFREASKVICTYGSRVLTLPEVSKDQMYPLKLKGISICFSLLKASLSGNYVNFGVFRLYGDDALDSALQMFVKLLLSIPQHDLMDYPKLSQTYFMLLECLAQDHMVFLAILDPQVILYLLSSLSEGLTALDTMVSTGCCATLDHIVTFMYKQISSKGKKPAGSQEMQMAREAVIKLLELQPELFQGMLSTVLNMVMYEDCRNQWSLSRPLLGLILLRQQYFQELREKIISQQPMERRAAMSQCFDSLMEDIEPNLLTKNRDKFTQNLSVFRRDITDSLRGNPLANTSLTNNNPSLGEMMAT
ncbi:unnamed protein product [Darwinula stevensoni]|uniref:Importin N-terminal domain-containing protein n=1 Tax=Darwinula stevensoni TaxID=69355 RepID=A0A7R8XDB0_9CRUS|nr:unnamed protein product [Darwinula stevensoni]CAG0893046.1 unnamed protein product [Darwinula stevensoni]